MELVGRAVRKSFPGFGDFRGVVESYDAMAGYFKVKYEDGDSEELDFEEIDEILRGMGDILPPSAGQEVQRGGARGRPRKRRRAESEDCRVEALGEFPCASVMENNGGGVEVIGGTGSGAREVAAREIARLFGEDSEGEFCLDSEKSIPEGWENAQMDEHSNGFGSPENIAFESHPSGSDSEERGRNKRRRVAEWTKHNSGVPLRRSARRVSKDEEYSNDYMIDGNYSSVTFSQGCVDDSVLDEKCSVAASDDLKPELPPSSSDLDIVGLPVLDLFSVYNCLRSFSRLLFLSPFSLRTFITALKCRNANPLIDSIHLSILQTLKPHLELLAEEGSQSAIVCMRSLNWELLDIVTWPVYLAEYLLVHGSAMSPDFKLENLKLLDAEYYLQPPEVKLEILRCVCDDVVEVETIRSELNQRVTMSSIEAHANYGMNIGRRKKESTMLALKRPLLVEAEETPDGNNDECCLCQMDGILICCDGCPAAFHSKCVGVAKDLLPEGDWFCPECIAEKGSGLITLPKHFHGEELLGIDPHGRLYFGSCGFLLVCESYNSVSSYHYYSKKDSVFVVDLLKLSRTYSYITHAISKYFNNTFAVSQCNNVSEMCNAYKDSIIQVLPELNASSKLEAEKDGFSGKKLENFSSQDNDSPKDVNTLDCLMSDQLTATNCVITCSAPTYELIDPAVIPENFVKTDSRCVGFTNISEVVVPAKIDDISCGQETAGLSNRSFAACPIEHQACQLQVHPDAYINSYRFGRVAYSVGAELMQRTSEKNNDSKKTPKDSQSSQLKATSKKISQICCFSYDKFSVNEEKEKCGWCCACRTFEVGGCMFSATDEKQLEGFKSRSNGSHDEKSKESHILSVIQHLLLIEERVRGFLSGLWDTPQYSKYWRNSVMKASDVSSLKHLLLILEFNLRRVVLTSDWMKAVDSAHTLGSASYISTNSAHTPSNSIGVRKLAKRNCHGAESASASSDTIGYSAYWWRGGRHSREIFQWKVLPRPLASKGARQAGCKKLTGLFYSDALEQAKRSKYVAWRASVEMSKNVSQLVCHVKDLDSNIRWAELLSTQFFPQLFKESKKLPKPLKKATICKKSKDGLIVKYLLDFGKRDSIPAIVMRHGVLFAECPDGRKKYWLTESHVPLNLLKAFEEKNIAQISKKIDSELPFIKEIRNNPKPKRLKYLAEIITKKQESDRKLCVQCNKGILGRDVVNCQYCNGLLHRKHFRAPKGAITTTYTCGSCKDKYLVKGKTVGNKLEKIPLKEKSLDKRSGKYLTRKESQGSNLGKTLSKVKAQGNTTKLKGTKKFTRKRRKVKLKNHANKRKVAVVKRKSKCRKKLLGSNKVSSSRNMFGRFEWSLNGASIRKRKRTVMHHSYWLNGLLRTSKMDDEQARSFKETNVVLPSEQKETYLMPECCLCHDNYNNRVLYISCQYCKDWFHGDTFGLTIESVINVIGFKCHKCLSRNIPMCAFVKSVVSDEIACK